MLTCLVVYLYVGIKENMKDEELKNIWRNPQIKVSDEQTNDSLKVLLNRIDLYESMSAKNKTTKWPMRLLKIAAIFLLPFFTYVLMVVNDNENHSKQPVIAKVKTNRYTALPGSKENVITLSDGTQITLNSDAVLFAPDSFINSTREVYLEGEAYFKIAKDAEHPFIVNTSYSNIQALGTEFAVIAEGEYTRTTLTEGRVRVSIPKSSEIEPIELSPSEQSYYNPSLEQISVRKVNTDIYTSWMKGNMVFDNTPFKEVFYRMEKQFGCKIEYENNQALSKQRITAKFIHKETLSDVLNTLQKVSNFSYRREKNTIYINH